MTLQRISPIANALDSLGRIAWELDLADIENPMALKGPLNWGFHATALFFYIRLQPEKGSFDQWVQDYFHSWADEITVQNDSRLEHREHLGLLEMIDLLSEVESESLRLEFYQGWTDKMARCRELRSKVQRLIGFALNESERSELLYLLALHNRLTHTPAPTLVDTQEAFRRLKALTSLLGRMIDPDWEEAPQMLETLERCDKCLDSLVL